MRMRKKPNLIPRMERCSDVQTINPEENRGKWQEMYPDTKELHLELGCGKGRFTVGTAEAIDDCLLIAIEKCRDAMVIGMERAHDKGIKNVQFIDRDVQKLAEMFEPNEVSRIYINFCDPWPKKKEAKRRLTAKGFLELYREVLAPTGEIHFKTDNLPLFEFSVESFRENGWELSELTNDLHENGPCGIMTDYEAKFYDMGTKINRCVAVYKGETAI